MNKKLTPICHALALALCAALTAPSAHADALISSATASITNLRYRLIDLDLTDGITPGLSINGAWISSLYGTGSDGETLGGSGDYTSGVQPFSNDAAVVTSLADGATSTTIGGSELTARSSLYQSNLDKVSTESSNSYSYQGVQNGVWGTVYQNYQNTNDVTSASRSALIGEGRSNPAFTLQVTAHTLLVVEGTFNSSLYLDRSSLVDSTILENSTTGHQVNIEHLGYGHAWSSMNVALTDNETAFNGDGHNGTVSMANWEHGLASTESGFGEDTTALTKTEASSKDWSTHVANLGNDTKTMFMLVGMDAYANYDLRHNVTINDTTFTPDACGTTNLPEPGTYALMGLGLVGMSLVRRRQAA